MTTPSYHYPSFLGLDIFAVRWEMAYEQDPEVLAALKCTMCKVEDRVGSGFWLGLGLQLLSSLGSGLGLELWFWLRLELGFPSYGYRYSHSTVVVTVVVIVTTRVRVRVGFIGN